MKRLLNTLRLVWELFNVASLLRAVWNYARDHFDDVLDFLESIGW